ncbi:MULTISPECIES: sensor histidine kinase [Nonomuraea]|uniref:histidine kinase n=1 Tax=Nonomuraea ferruginea TaxID=46174 RepID=A0ABT4SX44_9ACTN|nr:HAMP domain-containing sensor histidine kinase [Nonomuraea ferruginea]MDA0641625.1 HAMP domain-containing sensor histidine kinase [Nonomuraea ferruginea]
MIRRLSLRARLLAITVALLVAGLALVSTVVVRQLEAELLARIDAQLGPLATAAASMPPELMDLLRKRAAPAAPSQLDLIEEVRLAFLAADGTVVTTVVGAGVGSEVGTGAGPSSGAPTVGGLPRLPRLDAAAVEARAGRPFTVSGDDGEQWRTVAVPATRGTHASVVAAVSLDGMNSTVQRVRVASLVAGGLLLGLLALTGGFAIRAGLAPLRRVEETAAAIAAGDLSRRVPEPAGPGTEVGRLARSLNGMLAQIERGFSAREESEARMRRFVADVSHELRTPLFGIKGFSELYRMGGTDADAALARIESESARLAKLVDDLLLLATMDLATPNPTHTTPTPADPTPGAPTPADRTSRDPTARDRTPGDRTSEDRTKGCGPFGGRALGDRAAGRGAFGRGSSGDASFGDRPLGDRAFGDGSFGDRTADHGTSGTVGFRDGGLRDGAFGVGLDLTPMDLRTLAADARADLAALDPTRAITLTGPDDGPPGSAPVLGDEDRLRQVVTNLVGNAVTHTPPGTPVRIGVGTVGRDAALVIADSGPGLSPEQAERVFDRFYRADGSRNRTTGGAGLGLAIVRSIVTAHGGRVEIHSSPGEGATFRLLLPAEPQ